MKKNEDKSPFSAKVVPAVGLLLFGERAIAQDLEGGCGSDVVQVPEPSTFALFAIGAAAGAVVHAVKKRREK